MVAEILAWAVQNYGLAGLLVAVLFRRQRELTQQQAEIKNELERITAKIKRKHDDNEP